MAKRVLKEGEAKNVGKKYIIPPPKVKLKKKEEKGKEKSPFTEELIFRQEVEKTKAEIERLRHEWFLEEKRLKEEAYKEAEKIVKRAEDMAFAKIKESKAKANNEIQEAKKQAEKIIQDARFEAQKILEEAKEQTKAIIEENREKGYNEGREQGFNEGFEEAKRLIERLHKIVDEIIKKREEIIEGTEYQVISIVMLIVKKIIKVITENQKTVIINNVIEALKKIRRTKKIVIRVNLEDLDIVSKNKQKFIDLVEGLEEIQLLEDTTVDKGGCIIETDFGEIDARISLQLKEIEDKILELVPLKSRFKNQGK